MKRLFRQGLSNPRLVWLSLLLVASQAVPATPPTIALVMDDLGNHKALGEAALNLPGSLTFAFLPHTPFADSLAKSAHRKGKEIMLHLPMDAYGGGGLGPGALNLHMTEAMFKSTMSNSLEAIPHVVGVNNHMGSLLTRHPGAMAWVMDVVLERQGLYFIDSRTTHETVAQELAEEYGIPNTRRDVFLDNQRDPVSIKRQFNLLLSKAETEGYALGICHPYPETVRVLKSLLPSLEAQGIRLVSASEYIRLQRSQETWPEPSSPSPKVVKNSKR